MSKWPLTIKPAKDHQDARMLGTDIRGHSSQKLRGGAIDRPFPTVVHDYVARQVLKFVKSALTYRQMRPIPFSTDSMTAAAITEPT